MNSISCALHHETSLVGNEEILPLFSIWFSNKEKQQIQLVCSQCNPNLSNAVNLQHLLTRLVEMSQLPQLRVRKHLCLMNMALEKFKYIRQFKQRLSKVETKIMNEISLLVEKTDEIVHEQSQDKKYCEHLMRELVKIEDFEQLQEFEKHKEQLFFKIIPDPEKNKFDLKIENLKLEEMEKQCKSKMNKISMGFTQIQQYCMKIIEVVVNYEDQFDHENLATITKLYQNQRNYFNQHQPLSIMIQTQDTPFQPIKNKYLIEMDQKMKKVKGRIFSQLENLTIENNQLTQKNQQMKALIENNRKLNLQQSQTTINSERDTVLQGTKKST